MNQTLMQRISTNWTFTRFFYLLMGMVMFYQAFYDRQWPIAAFGLYFSSMGLFAFGCAGGNCYVVSSTTDNKIVDNTGVDTIDFEEIKSK